MNSCINLNCGSFLRNCTHPGYIIVTICVTILSTNFGKTEKFKLKLSLRKEEKPEMRKFSTTSKKSYNKNRQILTILILIVTSNMKVSPNQQYINLHQPSLQYL